MDANQNGNGTAKLTLAIFPRVIGAILTLLSTVAIALAGWTANVMREIDNRVTAIEARYGDERRRSTEAEAKVDAVSKELVRLSQSANQFMVMRNQDWDDLRKWREATTTKLARIEALLEKERQ